MYVEGAHLCQNNVWACHDNCRSVNNSLYGPCFDLYARFVVAALELTTLQVFGSVLEAEAGHSVAWLRIGKLSCLVADQKAQLLGSG